MTQLRNIHQIEKYNNPLSPYFKSFFLLDDRLWKSSAHYYQAQKFKDPNIQEIIQNLDEPASTPIFAYKNKSEIRKDWKTVKDFYMIKSLIAKFTQDHIVKHWLKSTGDDLLLCNSFDKYWGIGIDGTGENIYGQMLMKLRNGLILSDEMGKPLPFHVYFDLINISN